jgi:hypothetical protein
MPEPAESATASLEVMTHPDAEIFLIGNDRQLIQRAVGKLTTRQPKGLYRLKVTRATAAVEEILELDQDQSKRVQVKGLDTVVPFIRTLGYDNLNRLHALARGASSANVLLIGRMPESSGGGSGETPAPPLASFRVLRWGNAGEEAEEIKGDRSQFGAEDWQVASLSRVPGHYILEFKDGVSTTRQCFPVLPNWQTRIYVRRLPTDAGGGSSGLRPQEVIDVALHLSRPERPLALEPEFEPSEVVRIALAAGRRIVVSRDTLDIFLDEKFFDPLAGIAAAHLMFDGLERAESEAVSARGDKARLETQITRYDVDAVMTNLINLMHMAQGGISTDLVALKLRAGQPLTDQEKLIATPPTYRRSWEKLNEVSLGAAPQVAFEAGVYRQCVANFAAGPYFAWSPTSVANYVEQLVGSNRRTLRDVAASLSSKASESLPRSITEISGDVVELVGKHFAKPATERTNLKKMLGPESLRGLASSINQTEWMKKIGGQLEASDMDGIRTARDVAHTIGAKAAAALARAPGKIEAVLADEKNRADFADRLNIPRSMLDAILLTDDDAKPTTSFDAASE